MAIGGLHLQRPAPAGRPVRLAVRAPGFTGRDGLLARMRELLTGGAPGPRLLVLSGLGGIGKTSLAVQYAHEALDGYGLVWQIPAEEPAALSAGFAELARLLGVRDLVDGADPVAQVHAALAVRPGRWLLLLDNATDAAAVRDALPPAGDGDVLVTTRSAGWPRAVLLEVPPLDPASAVAFLCARTGDDDAGSAEAVAAELGALPLALEQAAAYSAETGRTLSEYLDRLRAHRSELLARGRPWGYALPVAATWQVAFQRLEQTAPAAITLLRLAAHCAPDALPFTTLPIADAVLPAVVADRLRALTGELAADDAVSALRQYALVTVPSGGVVSVHRLVQAVTLDGIPASERAAWREGVAALVEAALPGPHDRKDAWPRFAELLPHVLAACAPGGAAVAKVARYLGARGDYRAALIVQEQVRAHRAATLGAEHLDTLAAVSDLAIWTGYAGFAARAMDAFAELVGVLTRVAGPEHPDTLLARTWLSAWTGQAGDRAAARDIAAEVLPIRRRVSGDDHPDTLRVWHEIGFSTGQAGDPETARDLYEAFLPKLIAVKGPEDPTALSARDQHARWVGESGDPGRARDLSTALVPVFERVSGPEHIDVLWVRVNVAWWTGAAGDPAGARDLYAALLPLCERVTGPDSLLTLVARTNAAWWIGHAGDPATARHLTEALLMDRRRVYGADHPDTLTVQENLALWTARCGDTAAADALYARVRADRVRVLGPDHPETLATGTDRHRYGG